jgi:hypothetical protein
MGWYHPSASDHSHGWSIAGLRLAGSRQPTQSWYQIGSRQHTNGQFKEVIDKLHQADVLLTQAM